MESLTVEISGHYSKHRLHDDSSKWRELDSLLAASALRQFTVICARAESDYQHYWDLNWAEPEDFDSVLPALFHSGRLDVQLESTLSPMLCVSIWLMLRSSHSIMGPLVSI